jgi:hypothetical protein
LTVWIIGTQCTVSDTTRSSGRAGIKMTSIAIVPRCFTGYKYSFRPAPLPIRHFFTFSFKVFSLPLHLIAMEEKRCIKRSRFSRCSSSSSSSGASTPPPSLSESLLPPVSPSEVSSRRSSSPVHEHNGCRSVTTLAPALLLEQSAVIRCS